MNFEAAAQIGRTLLYEGYLLYPHGPTAVENRKRFNWGLLQPRGYAEGPPGTESWRLQAECVLECDDDCRLEAEVRCLQLVERVTRPYLGASTWTEGRERRMRVGPVPLATLIERDAVTTFAFEGGVEVEHVGTTVIERTTHTLVGEMRLCAERVGPRVARLSCRVVNLTSGPGPPDAPREAVLPYSLVSTHVVLGCVGGAFVSQFDPPEGLGPLTDGCENVGVFPVLVGEPGARDIMLCSPIILHDHPTVAGRSLGDPRDGTEIDEMLSLRILTLTEQERDEACEADAMARDLLERTERMGPADLIALHGALRRVDPDPKDGG